MPKLLQVYDNLSKTDQVLFDFDIRKLDWNLFFMRYVRGGRIQLLNEPLDNIYETRRHYRRFIYLHYGTVIVLGLVLLYHLTKLIHYLF